MVTGLLAGLHGLHAVQACLSGAGVTAALTGGCLCLHAFALLVHELAAAEWLLIACDSNHERSAWQRVSIGLV